MQLIFKEGSIQNPLIYNFHIKEDRVEEIENRNENDFKIGDSGEKVKNIFFERIVWIEEINICND